MPAEITPEPTGTSVTLTDEATAAFTAEAAEGETAADVLQAKVDEQAIILRTDQINAKWNALTLEEKEALIP